MGTISPQYVAGFFDGEGCVGLYGNSGGTKTYRPRARFTNTNRKVLLEIQKAYGGCLYSSKSDKGENFIHRLDISRKDSLRKLFGEIREYLVIKDTQADVLIDFLDGKIDGDKARVRLRAMKSIDHVLNAELLGYDYLERKLNNLAELQVAS